ncbi:SDR family oxidoreductase [Nocardioides soli]|uniref:3-oxoacyl-[acyl-carrier protein] reductase n=1 Tax=Nocardioides soli TaxID=1036020 RepID=A0A7W4VWX1_9ACTN|nr:SDR family oxidoreductase [Nocardioides soli]MBB3042869.1 3-oxoacyl-[acyl-carrier protein] reductase [Nocardioides soli]
MRRLEGRAAIVTGASRGIGFAIAERLIAEGASVCITARNAEALTQAVDKLGRERACAVAGRADDAEHQRTTVRHAIERFGRLDVLVNNTGINPVVGPLVEADLDAGRKIVGVNCFGTLAWVQAAYRAWMREHGGVVVNVSSVAGLRPARDIALYGASKAMLNYLTQSLAMELAPAIRVNAVAPAVVRTRFGAPLFEGHEDEVTATYPLGRLGEPEDIAAAVAYLAADESSWITGQVVVADGGLTLQGGV